MNVSHIQAHLAAVRADPQNSPEGPSRERAARSREIARAVQAINNNEVFGPGSELRFALDRESGRNVIRLVDRVTNEVVKQFPVDDVLRMAAVLKELESNRVYYG